MLGRVTPNYHSEWVTTAHASAVRLCKDLCECVCTHAVSWTGDAFEAERGHSGISVRSVDTPPYKQTSIIASSTDHEAIPIGEADVGQVCRVAQKTLVFGKFLWTWKVEQLHHSKVITGDDVDARVRHTGAGHVSFICVPGPDPHHFIP